MKTDLEHFLKFDPYHDILQYAEQNVLTYFMTIASANYMLYMYLNQQMWP